MPPSRLRAAASNKIVAGDEAQKSMRLFAIRLALITEIFCEKIIAQSRDVESVAPQAREECIRRSK
jgi:hypothetical protein